MVKKRLAILVTNKQRQDFFEDHVITRLHELTDLLIYNGNKAPTPSDAAIMLKDAHACITSWGSPCFTEELLDDAPNLRLIIYAAGSVKPIVSPAVYERGITITSGASAISPCVAESALGLIIISMKNIFEMNRITKQQGWKAGRTAMFSAKEMVGTSVGVVGAGHVGSHLLHLLRNFRVRVLLYDPFMSPEKAHALGATLTDLDTLMQECDVISLHAPSLPSTRHMINERRLKLMKDGATLINTARGSLVDEQALINELKSGRIRACLDVTDPEPPADDSPLRYLDNVVLTPHMTGTITTGLMLLGRYALEEVERFVSGQPPLNSVSSEQLANLA
jgi:phosphoglycerate dehydrogenase-like enzyme